jgi:hypothetical protein
VATTSTFGTDTPSLLVTVPVTLAKCVCACSETQPAANAHDTSTAIHRFFMNRLLRDVLSRLVPLRGHPWDEAAKNRRLSDFCQAFS